MPSAQPHRSLAEQIKGLADPAPPRDLDPEGFGDAFDKRAGASDSEEEEQPDQDAGREHYEAVGKSNLRQTELPELGRQYAGSKVNRATLAGGDDWETEDSEDSGEDEDGDIDMPDSASDDGPSDGSSASSATDSDDAPRRPAPKAAPVDRAELRAVMAEEHKAVASAISQATKEDAAKGAAVQTQRRAHAALLRTRIQLQKALSSANSLAPALHSTGPADKAGAGAALHSAEAATLSLLDSLAALQASLPSAPKRAHAAAFAVGSDGKGAPSEELAAELGARVAAARPRHRATLDKWARKTHAAPAARANRLGAAGAALQQREQPLSSVLEAQLAGAGRERAVLRTRVPRSCAPAQAAAGIKEDADVFDDADWYAVLLQELIDARGGEAGGVDAGTGGGAEAARLRRENRMHRRGVDTKASKGRKLRFTVHEKLLNFMAPRDLSSWEERKKDEFFAGLLGRKVQGGLREDEDDGSSEEDEVEGLKLFQGQ